MAISFLNEDEPLAVKLCDELSESLRVFIYSKRQEELAGTDGLESFRKAFLSNSRLVVVLYRDGWGKTKWTAVEEMAIKERVFDGGWDSLLFVMLDDKSTRPGWLPNTHIRLNYESYGNSLIGAIKMRAQELGSSLKVETATERARRAQSSELLRAERDRLLAEQGSAAVRKQHEALRNELDDRIADIQKELTSIKLETGADGHEYVIRTGEVSLNFYLYPTSPITESRVVVQEFNAPLILLQDRARRMYVHGEEPKVISKREFHFDYEHTLGWCWRDRSHGKSEESLLTTDRLAEHLIKRVFELHEKFRSGHKVRYRETGGSGVSGGSLGWMR